MAQRYRYSGEWNVKVFVVLQRDNLVPEGRDNMRIIAVKLSRSAAEKVRDEVPGTRIERHYARK